MTDHAQVIPENAVIGLIGGRGRMGQMFQRLFEADGHQVLVAGRSTELTYEALAEQADVVILSVPVNDTPAMVNRISSHLRPGQLLSDFTSIKREPVEAMLTTPADVIGCHPVFGPMQDPSEQNVVLCPVRPGRWLEWYEGFFTRHGMKVLQLTPEEHDEAMAFIQGLTHFLNISFARTLQTRSADLQRLLSVCSPVYRLFFSVLSRILSGSSELYGQIQTSNPGNVPVAEEFLANGQELLELVKRKDIEGVNEIFDSAAEYLGAYKQQARDESDYLIEQLIPFLRNR